MRGDYLDEDLPIPSPCVVAQLSVFSRKIEVMFVDGRLLHPAGVTMCMHTHLNESGWDVGGVGPTVVQEPKWSL